MASLHLNCILLVVKSKSNNCVQTQALLVDTGEHYQVIMPEAERERELHKTTNNMNMAK